MINKKSIISLINMKKMYLKNVTRERHPRTHM